MLLLALDTATPAVTVALHDGERVLAEVSEVDARRHAELLAPGIEAVLAQAGATTRDLTAVAVGTGPGPFTGLRVGLVTARTLGATLQVPVHGVCTLDVLASQAVADGVVVDGEFVVATDARRREVYWARYSATSPGAQRISGPEVALPADVPDGSAPVVGRGADLYPDALGARVGPADPSAGAMAALVVRLLQAGADLSDTAPLYLRRPDVHEGGARKSVLG
ncbi:tRNA (adenosine(37)-N6)-threonylcarbamoyltransferase complex dimerization subunit type 1 TsaB [Angustibacter sp. Root456]|uniref:tRNA (adenosine(37)-N6)-threonylcarbamoyltransferase complex dimerization subunit type 1 TsaB n=1 Tax=Angustibacter sp. Root456 TaxID=1736539 RepID=UPI0006F9A1D3|nr:tRNA (adenosine(37)-N6)-threonylcarbamoyltransferase complex dimerization subunit type 1 TsaB [Angustibacter sp. Root456]KQX66311.1 tRNA threonylcarbamoyladenosine biosynthesis protein TsaB [Angustibacter sp. Root456]